MSEYNTVRGMRDFLPKEAKKMNYIKNIVIKEFKAFGFEPMQTPIVEEFKLLSKKGAAGEAIKEEIYYFKDKSKRELGLRFEFTVSLARVIASNPQLKKPFKRYQIGTIYRYDRPGKKRYREFTQADADIIGSNSIYCELELIQLFNNILSKLGIEFIIRINSRKLLKKIGLAAGLKEEELNEAFRSIDKIDKIGLNKVKEELKEKKINEEILNLIQKNLKEIEVILKEKNLLKDSEIDKLKELIELCKEIGLDKKIKIDLSLARGLDYYTGIVFEANDEEGKSLFGGGRFNKLIENYGGQKNPAIGFGIGIDRLYDLMKEKKLFEGKIKNEIVFIAVMKGTEKQGFKIAQNLREKGLKISFNLSERNISKQLEYASEKKFKKVIIIGENELKKGKIILKDMINGKQKELTLEEIVKELKTS